MRLSEYSYNKRHKTKVSAAASSGAPRGGLTVTLGWKRETASPGLTEMRFWSSLVVTQRDVSASAPPVSIAHT